MARLIAVRDPGLQLPPRELAPGRGIVRQVQGRPGEGRRPRPISPALGLQGRREMFFSGPRAGPMLTTQPLRLLEGWLHIPIRQEGKLLAPFGRCRPCRRIRLDHIGRKGPGKERSVARIVLDEARPVVGVEDISGTARVGQAGPLAGFDRRVEDAGDIAARKILVLGHDKPALGNQVLRLNAAGCAKKYRRDRSLQKPTHQMPPAWIAASVAWACPRRQADNPFRR